jgi:dTDP-4-dehydrorhamnose 3,5-epimerase
MTPIAFTPSSENQVGEYLYQMPLEGLLYIAHKRADDQRGFYSELDRLPEIESYLGLDFHIRQINLSHSNPNVIRGFHTENWNKLLTVVHGACFCAWADFRHDSPSLGQVVTLTMGVEPPHAFGSVFVSSGIANSFCAAFGTVDYLYSVDALYADRDTSGDMAISLFDPDLNVTWPIAREEMVISQRDLDAQSFASRFGKSRGAA